MASQALFRGRIRHTDKTVEQLYKTEYHVYEKTRILLRLLLGMALVLVAAFSAFPTWVRVLLLLFGAWFLASGDFPAQIRADRVMQSRKADLPAMEYAFFPDRVELSGEGSMTVRYPQFTRLVQDEEYLYLILARDSICMLERESISPKGDQEFMKFMEQKTKLAWRREKGFLSLTFWDLRDMLRDRKQK